MYVVSTIRCWWPLFHSLQDDTIIYTNRSEKNNGRSNKSRTKIRIATTTLYVLHMYKLRLKTNRLGVHSVYSTDDLGVKCDSSNFNTYFSMHCSIKSIFNFHKHLRRIPCVHLDSFNGRFSFRCFHSQNYSIFFVIFTHHTNVHNCIVLFVIFPWLLMNLSDR